MRAQEYKTQLGNEVLKQMKYICENIGNNSDGLGAYLFPFEKKGAFPFKPGLADRLIFNKILDVAIPRVVEEESRGGLRESYRGIAINLLKMYYWPDYGWNNKFPPK